MGWLSDSLVHESNTGIAYARARSNPRDLRDGTERRDVKMERDRAQRERRCVRREKGGSYFTKPEPAKIYQVYPDDNALTLLVLKVILSGSFVLKTFSNPTSDALSIAYALQCFELVASQVNFCNHYVLHLKMMEEMFEA
ncbi:hypothetical protein LguiB_012907 [Lonicera macranthoides]